MGTSAKRFQPLCILISFVIGALAVAGKGQVLVETPRYEGPDFSVDYDSNGKFDIGIGRIERGARYSIKFTFEELDTYWRRQPHKEFILITLAPGTWMKGKEKEIIDRIRSYFFKVGFRRVRIERTFPTVLDAPSPVLSDDIRPDEYK